MANVNSTPSTLRDRYTLSTILGKGTSCTAYLCVDNSPPHGRYTCKSITVYDDDTKEEIKLMHHLSDCPGVMQIKETIREADGVHIIMEFCEGGDLHNRMVKKKRYNEQMAAKIMRSIVKVVMDFHSLGVMHRNLNLDNFLIVKEGDDSELKKANVGQSIFFEPGQTFMTMTGSPYYIAPEVVTGSYGPESDVWSAGVILYILLSGYAPFPAKKKLELLAHILLSDLDLESDPWPTISESAKDLVSKMLNKNAEERITAHQALCHEWMVNNGIAPEGPPESAVLTRLRNFSGMNILKKMAIRYTAERLPEEETSGLREMFRCIDTDNSGEITFDKLKDGLKRLGSEAEDSEIKALMDEADTDGSGTIDRKEFVAAMFHKNKMEREANLRKAFEHLNKDGSGYITVNEVRIECLEFGFTDDNLKDAFRETDQNNDGKIDYDEFVAMMKGGSNAGQRSQAENKTD